MARISGSGGSGTLAEYAGVYSILGFAADGMPAFATASTRLEIDARAQPDAVRLTVSGGGPTYSGFYDWAAGSVGYAGIESFTIYSNAGDYADAVQTGDGDDVFHHYASAGFSEMDVVDLGGGENDLLVADFSAVSGFSVSSGMSGSYRLFDVAGHSTIAYIGVERLHFIGGDEGDVVTGHQGSDILEGRAGADTLDGGDGADSLDGGTGIDMMTGGDGDDTFFVDDAADMVIELAWGGIDRVVASSATYQLPDHVEQLSAAGAINHRFRANALDNIVAGASGNDTLLLQDGGVDSAFGDAGNDVLYFGAGFTNLDRADGGVGRDAIVLQGNYALTFDSASLIGIESISLQSGANASYGDTANHYYDYAIATADANVAAGQQMIVNGQSLRAGEDLAFDGSAETDGSFLVYAGHGVDTLEGGSGNDIFFFEGARFGASDRVDGGAGRDAVVISAGSGLNRYVFGETSFANIESISVSNRYTTDPTQKPAYELVLANGNVTPGGTLIVNGSSLNSFLQFIRIDGSAVQQGNLMLFGGTANDTLKGGGGDDLLVGGVGSDSLYGGAGKDVFRYDSQSHSNPMAIDMIFDFAPGEDLIDFSRIDANTHSAGDQAFTWIGLAAFTGAGAASAGELRAYYDNYQWYVAADTNGDGTADFRISIIPPSDEWVPSAADFML